MLNHQKRPISKFIFKLNEKNSFKNGVDANMNTFQNYKYIPYSPDAFIRLFDSNFFSMPLHHPIVAVSLQVIAKTFPQLLKLFLNGGIGSNLALEPTFYDDVRTINSFYFIHTIRFHRGYLSRVFLFHVYIPGQHCNGIPQSVR